jgi:5-methylthioadenosine/S-adenosylhomocysteine deaminase
MTSLLVHNARPLDSIERTIYVSVEGERIAELGEAPSRELLARAERVMDATDQVLVPGLVNAHTHLFQTFLRGLGDDRPLLEWLKRYIWPASRAMTEEDFYWSALLGIVENLRGGATAAIDNSYVQLDPRAMDAVAEAARVSGFRLVIARGYVDREYPPEFHEPIERVLGELGRLMAAFPPSDRLGWAVAPVVPWGVSEEALRAGAAFAAEHGLRLHMHTAESQGEIDLLAQRTGLRHVEWLERLGLLDERWQLVHAVLLSARELELVQRANAMLIYNPVSNMYLASGIAPIARARQLGIRIAWATDGPGSNNSQDMLEVLKTGVNLQKIGQRDAAALSSQAALEMASQGGYDALGPPELERGGRLEVGAPADFSLVNLRRAHSWPVHSPLSALIYCARAGDVETVVVGGRPLLERGRVTFLDEEELFERTDRLVRELRGRAGLV